MLLIYCLYTHIYNISVNNYKLIVIHILHLLYNLLNIVLIHTLFTCIINIHIYT